jgi:hypothetical protein
VAINKRGYMLDKDNKMDEVGELKDDIQREPIENEKDERDNNFRFSSALKHIKKNWFDIKPLNKNFKHQ